MARARPLSITTAGLRELQSCMKRLESAVEPKDVNPVLLSAVDLIKTKALENLRESDVHVKTGNLERSLISRIGKSTTIASAWVKAGTGKFGLAPHAHLIEFGHRIVGHKPTTSSVARGHIAQVDTGKVTRAFPFFRPAVDAMRANIRKAIDEGIAKLLWDSVK